MWSVWHVSLEATFVRVRQGWLSCPLLLFVMYDTWVPPYCSFIYVHCHILHRPARLGTRNVIYVNGGCFLLCFCLSSSTSLLSTVISSLSLVTFTIMVFWSLTRNKANRIIRENLEKCSATERPRTLMLGCLLNLLQQPPNGLQCVMKAVCEIHIGGTIIWQSRCMVPGSWPPGLLFNFIHSDVLLQKPNLISIILLFLKEKKANDGKSLYCVLSELCKFSHQLI